MGKVLPLLSNKGYFFFGIQGGNRFGIPRNRWRITPVGPAVNGLALAIFP